MSEANFNKAQTQNTHDPLVLFIELLIKIDKREHIVRKSDEAEKNDQENN
jgi:hypothetical protein